VVSFDVAAPDSRPYESWHFDNEHGQRVHGFVVTPDDSGGPFPVMMFVHGGPTWLDIDRWQPEVQAYVDLGFVIGLVNYRGSIGYGREWRDTLVGNIGGPELEDVNAGLRDLVARGLADPERAVIAGYSWGGYVTLLEVGKHPELWTCGIAGVPVGDYEAGYEELSPNLQAYDRALLGGKTPAELPDLMRERNAINFADDVRAPVLFFIGRNDSRCPYNQAMAYVDKLAAREHPHEVVVYDTGHASYDVDEKVAHVGVARDFLRRHVPGLNLAAGIAATPGSSLPSRSSSDAPPPVETQEMRSASPASWTARTESPPPTTVNASASASATASAIAFVPSAKRAHSKTPIGPFQKTVRAPRMRSPKAWRVSGPMSRPSQPSGTSS
jgi:dienelactone hydrolase